jgi:TRAP-type C4-dicarboxylate transport system permease small subunit
VTTVVTRERAAADGFLPVIDTAFRSLENTAAVVGGAMMLFAMVLMSLDATMRYLFNSPIQIASRLIEFYLMVGMFAMPLAWGFRTGGYIRIVIVVGMLPARIRSLVLRIGLLVSSVYVGGLAWMSGVHFLDAWRSGEVYVGVLDWSVAWSWIWVPVGLGLLVVRLVLLTLGPAANLHVAHGEDTDGAK